MTFTRHVACCLIGVGMLLSCKPQGPAPNSPTHDHQPPATNPGDGEIIGADRVSPAQKLAESPKVDSDQGLKSADQPGKD